MSYKIATYVTLLLVITLAIVFFFISKEFSFQPNQSINSATFPQIVCVLLIIMSIISFFKTMKQKDEKVEMLNFRYIVYTIIATVVFLVLWEITGYFYLLMSALFAFLFYLYNNNNKHSKRKVLNSIVFAFIVASIIYIIFKVMLGVVF